MEKISFPHPKYALHILEPAFEVAKKYFFHPLMAINKAHVLMLIKQGIIGPICGKALLQALIQIESAGGEKLNYKAGEEDLYFCVENKLIELAGLEIGGNLQIARSRNDLSATMCRLVLREFILELLKELNDFRRLLLDLARRHLTTLMPGYTHSQPAQPTTLAHYLSGVTSFLERDGERLQAAYVTTNRSPLGAAAFATTGFPIDRYFTMRILGFPALVENSYDAIGASDHMTQGVTALLILASNLSRLTQDLLFWATKEVSAIQVGSEFAQISSIMPQKRNPVVLEHLRAMLGQIYGDALAVLTLTHSVPYGDIVDIEDRIYPPLFRGWETGKAILELYASVISSLIVDTERLLKRAGEGFIAATELADTLVREEGLDFRRAHTIVSQLVSKALATGLSAKEVTLELVNEVAQRVLGRPLKLTEEGLKRALDPLNFVTIRQIVGGPSPETMGGLLNQQEEKLMKDRGWLEEEKERLKKADNELKRLITEAMV